MEPFIGSILIFGGNFAPRGWALCDGQLLSIPQNTALFSIIGTTYGGDGVSTFGLPDLRGRAPIHMGTGPGLTHRSLGSRGGEQSVTLTTAQMPAHNHPVNAADTPADFRQPTNALLTQDGNYTQGAADVVMNPAMIANTGGGQPHDNMQPFVTVNFIIALTGLFPSRS